MALIKATFVMRLETEDLQTRYVFLISPDDLRLMNIPSIRHYDPSPVPRVTEGTDIERMTGRPLLRAMSRSPEISWDVINQRGLAVELPFSPEATGGRPDERPLPGLVPDLSNQYHAGREFWVLLRGPFRTSRVHTYDGAFARTPNSLYPALGIYPVIEPKELNDYREDLDRMPWHLHQNPGIPSMADALDAILEETPGMRRRNLELWWRCWGMAVSMPLVHGMLELGQRLYARGPDAPRLGEFYSAYARTGDSPKMAEDADWIIRAHTDREYSPEDPLRGTVLDMSNPNEYGSPGALLPLAMIDNPYAFVGAAATKGVSVARAGSGVRTRFPWWISDLLARLIYGEAATTNARLSALVYETLLLLEQRSRDAFRELGQDGFPRAGGEDSPFDFDSRGPLPAGSTVFDRSLVERGILRRVADVEGAIERDPRRPKRQVWLAGIDVPNPYPALAGFLGLRMQPLPEMRDPAARWEAARRVVTAVEHPNTEGLLEHRFGLRERIRAARHAVQAMMQQEVAFGRGSILPAEPALRRDDPRWETQAPPPQRLLATDDQAHALETIYRWRFSMVTGGPGTGKTALQRELARLAAQLSEDAEHERVIYLVLTPTNRAARNVLEHMRAQTDNIQLIGATGADIAAQEVDLFTGRADAGVIVGTVDSFLRKVDQDQQFAELFMANHVIIAFDEGGMLTHEAFVDVVSPFREIAPGDDSDAYFQLRDNLLRVVIFGDPSQMESIAPGDFLHDCLALLPVTRLVEQMRFGGEDRELADFFDLLRRAMENGDARRDVAEVLVEKAQNPDPGSLLRVILVDDLPPLGQLPHLHTDWFQRFRLELEDEVRRILFRELLDWSRIELSAVSRRDAMPLLPHHPAGADLARANEDHEKFRRAMADPLLPFVVTTMVRRMHSTNPRLDKRTHYLSSSERINGWIHDALRGRLFPMDPEYLPTPVPGTVPVIEFGDERVRFLPQDAVYVHEHKGRFEKFQTVLRELAGAHGGRENVRKFLSDYRPHTLMLSPGWPYVVLTNDFKSLGVFRGERVRYVRAFRHKAKAYQVFISEAGTEISIANRYCTRAYLSYGWASNVHQVQGAEFPLVVVVWMDGINSHTMAREWDRIRPLRDGYRVIPNLEPLLPRAGGARYPSIDDPLDLHALYTAVTRTQSRPVLPARVGGHEIRQTGRGRCVLVVGKHALRRFLSLHSYRRVTAIDGLLREMLDRTG